MSQTNDELLARLRTDLSNVEANLILRELILQKELSTARVEMAAQLGSPIAMFFVALASSEGEPSSRCKTPLPPLPKHYPSKIRVALAPLDPIEKIRFAFDCFERVERLWTRELPTDQWMPIALTLVQPYFQGLVRPLSEMELLKRQLQTVLDEFDDYDKQIYKHPNLLAAHASLSSISCVVGAVKTAEKLKMTLPNSMSETIENSCAEAARYAVAAKTAEAWFMPETSNSDAAWLVEKAEECWQTQRLFNYLLKRIE